MTLLGGLRLGAPVRFVPPPLIAIVVGLLLVAALIRATVLEPRDFVGAHRKPLEQASGIDGPASRSARRRSRCSPC